MYPSPVYRMCRGPGMRCRIGAYSGGRRILTPFPFPYYRLGIRLGPTNP